MAFFDFIDKWCWPVSILATIFNIAFIVLISMNGHWPVWVLLIYVAVGIVVFLYMILYMRLDFFGFIWGMICGGWKIGWTLGKIIFFIPGMNIIGSLVLAVWILILAIELCIVFITVLPVTLVIYKEFLA